VPKLAKSPPPPSEPHQPLNPRYKLLRSFAFRREAWPGYEHRMTKGERAGGTGTTGGGGEDRTWEFCLATDTAG
jgi:25S rRNA (uracil2634-N3)-methyltransferase